MLLSAINQYYQLVDNLEKLKLVKRISSKEDRRRNLIYLTDTAKKLQEQSMEVADQTLNEALASVPAEDVELCKAYFKRYTITSNKTYKYNLWLRCTNEKPY